MSDIVFVTPNMGGSVREEPIGTLLLATILRNAGFSVEILQFHHFGNIQEFDSFIHCAMETIMSRKPRVVSFYTRCDTYHISLRIAERLWHKSPKPYIVFGGAQADLSAKETMEEIPYVDYICCGEGETTVVPFFSSLLKEAPDLSIPGLTYRDCGSVVQNPKPELISDLDTLPTIDYTLLDFNVDDNASDLEKLFPVDVGRGCPFGCTYCSTKTFWGRKYRLKSAERIIQEIIEIHNRFGATSFNFEHDMFTLNRNKIIRICKMLKELDFPVTFRCSARIDCLDEELIDIMTDAGMNKIFIGIETGSPRMQKLIQKNLKLDMAVEKLTYISQKGVNVTASFIFGLPEETEEDFSQTIRLMTSLCHLPNITLQHHLLTFFPGTELTNQYQDKLSRANLLSNITGELAVKECEDIVTAHPVLFPHFHELQSDFRKKVQYYPQFFRCWKQLRLIYEYIGQKYYSDNLCSMLIDFTQSNLELLQAEATLPQILMGDRFLERFAGDENYSVLKEISRFYVWRLEAQIGQMEIFEYDVSTLQKHSKLEEIEKCMVAATVTQNNNGKKKIQYFKC